MCGTDSGERAICQYGWLAAGIESASRMNTYGRLAAILIALTLFGCKGPLQASSASAAAGGSVAGEGAGAAAPSSGTRVEGIPDTTLDNKIAFNVIIPAKWKFNGILLQGGIPTCESYAYAVYRATSEDGVTFGEAMPQLMWAWGNGPKPTKGCLPLTGPLSAQEFLKYVSTTMQVEYVGEAAMPDALANGVQQTRSAYAQPAPFYAAHNLPAPKNTADGAAATVRYKNGPVSMMGRLTTYITCTETTQPGMKSMLRGMPDRPASTVGKCTANVAYVTAPEGKFAAVVRLWDGPEMGIRQNKEWGDAWVQRYAKNGKQVSDGMIQTSWDRVP
jgi:hypothetical protein